MDLITTMILGTFTKPFNLLRGPTYGLVYNYDPWNLDKTIYLVRGPILEYCNSVSMDIFHNVVSFFLLQP